MHLSDDTTAGRHSQEGVLHTHHLIDLGFVLLVVVVYPGGHQAYQGALEDEEEQPQWLGIQDRDKEEVDDGIADQQGLHTGVQYNTFTMSS